MRLLIEIVVAALLIGLLWSKSSREWAGQAPIIGPYLTAPARPHARSASAPARPEGTPTSVKSFTGHITYIDEQGRVYWLDAQGVRHYER